MIKLASAAAIVLAVCPLPSQAWWDNIWSDDFFGEGFGTGEFDFGFSMQGRGHGRGYGYDAPYRGYAPYYRPPYYAAPVPNPTPAPSPTPALTEEQRAAFIEQQKAIAEQQQEAFQRAVAAQREYAERLSREMMSPPELPADINKRIQEHEAKREAMIRGRDPRYGSAPLTPPRTGGMRPLDETRLRRSELPKPQQQQHQHQHNPVLTQPDTEM
jgi:hypothetical protein